MSPRNTRLALIVMGIVVFIVTAAVAVIGWAEIEDVRKLRGVESAGPCRESYRNAIAEGANKHNAVQAATRNDECQRQSFLLFKTCIRRELHPACRIAKGAVRQRQERGDAQQAPPSASQQPVPPQGGAPGNGNPPQNPPPKDGPPATPDDPGLLGPVCTATEELLELC